MKEKKNGASFWRKNAYYIIIAVCATAIIVMSTFAIINLTDKEGKIPDNQGEQNDPNGDDDPNTGNDDPSEPVVVEIVLGMPVENVNVIKESTTDTVPVSWNETMNRYESHIAIDFGGVAGDNVFAVYDGVVKSNTTDALEGTTIIIDHGNGLETVYMSLAEAGTLKAGDSVSKGDIIGQMSASFKKESVDGAHLHFEVYENDLKINPSKYLVFEEK